MLNSAENITQLSHREMLDIHRDYQQAAAIASLVYVDDNMPGIRRYRKGKGFYFMRNKKRLDNKEEIARIRKLAIPPAWTEVWICPLSNGHLQATGKDLRKRKQYRYHPNWQEVRNETKFHRLYEFGKVLPRLRLLLEKDITRKELCQEKVLATVISLMERTYIRIGSNDYEKMYGSYGLTTFKDNHVSIEGNALRFSFKGKKGVYHSISLKNKRLATIVRACRDIPGKELFQYYDADGQRHAIDSGMVNEYIRKATGGDYTSKDFRTWAGTLNILRSFRIIGQALTEAEKKKKVVEALDAVSMRLGNTRTVCRKYYVHPGIIRLYEADNLQKYLDQLNDIEEPDNRTDLTSEEKVLMKVLKQVQTA
ncbi:MAG: DNA topoisomerase IB [Candidatus Pseudobacter hemicellulosilyticus]|uniref:DNA topoisomerase IB n=1 Tax=Candidatus Pseudobacter hemicellulosilyticus TaxID=3121375 RepID=A0AAJ6BDC2_9BACT|nr:MAG: DNA topoisomerase IB [Pseudobacter sp.]